MEIPLSKRLRKRAHQEVALLQDELVEMMYAAFQQERPVLHGGTAIWRCYKGNRFSEDLDFYAREKKNFRELFFREAAARGLEVTKYKQTSNVIFAKVSNGSAEVRLEINTTKTVSGIVAEYEKVNGWRMDVLTLSPEELIREKMSAYETRRMARDIYDIYHLSRFVGEVRGMREFLRKAKPPVDEKNLRAVVYSGVAPSFTQMVEALSRRFSK
ncbi:MAG: nucleotidyl transferase AbiEii/AbiGii toxin family protein [Candidatus Micrarchaeia archaeon]